MYRHVLIILMTLFPISGLASDNPENQSKKIAELLSAYHHNYDFINIREYVFYQHPQTTKHQIDYIENIVSQYEPMSSLHEDDSFHHTPSTIPTGGIIVYEVNGDKTSTGDKLLKVLPKLGGTFEATEYGLRSVRDSSHSLSEFYYSTKVFDFTCSSFYLSRAESNKKDFKIGVFFISKALSNSDCLERLFLDFIGLRGEASKNVLDRVSIAENTKLLQNLASDN